MRKLLGDVFRKSQYVTDKEFIVNLEGHGIEYTGRGRGVRQESGEPSVSRRHPSTLFTARLRWLAFIGTGLAGRRGANEYEG